MSDSQHNRIDPWDRAIRPARRLERSARRPKPGPGRHRPEAERVDPWQRALTGPPISISPR